MCALSAQHEPIRGEKSRIVTKCISTKPRPSGAPSEDEREFTYHLASWSRHSGGGSWRWHHSRLRYLI